MAAPAHPEPVEGPPARPGPAEGPAPRAVRPEPVEGRAARPCEAEPDWRPGDLAECIHPGDWFSIDGPADIDAGPRYSEVRMVRRVDRVPDLGLFAPVPMLGFDRWQGRLYPARCFRKVTPRREAATAADPAIIGRYLRAPA